MILTDVNVLLYAHRSELPDHDGCKRWLDSATQSAQRFAVSELVLSAFVRIATNPRVFKQPTPVERALEFTTELRSAPNAVVVSPGPNHWRIFSDLCRATRRQRQSRPGRLSCRPRNRARSRMDHDR